MSVIAVESKMEPWVETVVASQTMRICRKLMDGHGKTGVGDERSRSCHAEAACLDDGLCCGACLDSSRRPHLIARCLFVVARRDPRLGNWDGEPTDGLGSGGAGPGGWWCVACDGGAEGSWVLPVCSFAGLVCGLGGRPGSGEERSSASTTLSKSQKDVHCPHAQAPNVWSQFAQSRCEWPGTPSSQFIGDCESRRAWTARTASHTPATLVTWRSFGWHRPGDWATSLTLALTYLDVRHVSRLHRARGQTASF